MQDLLEALKAHDGRTNTVLEQIRESWSEEPGFPAALAQLIDHKDGHITDGATWLLKEVSGSGTVLDTGILATILEKLDALTSWGAQLHLCQSVQYWPLDRDGAQRLASWLEAFLAHERPFLRAWSMDALQYCARINPDLVSVARGALNRAKQDKAASVRARARQLELKKG